MVWLCLQAVFHHIEFDARNAYKCFVNDYNNDFAEKG